MAIIDTHTHLDSFHRKGLLPETLQRAREGGLEALVSIGTCPEDWVLYRGLSREHPGFIHYAAGLHPCSVDERWSEATAQLESFWLGDQEPVAMGETGLDRFHLPKEAVAAERLYTWQRASFAAHLELARRLACPLVIHSRGAFQDCVEMIDRSGVDWTKVVFHCFTEGPQEMSTLLERGAFGSFTGVLTYKNAPAVREAALLQGLDRFMLETDAPYLTPMPHRGKPNEPAYLAHTARFAAELFGVSYEELARRSSANARRFFQLASA